MSSMAKNMYFTIAILSHDHQQYSGRLYSPIFKDYISFSDLTELIMTMEYVMQKLNIPKYGERFGKFQAHRRKVHYDIQYQQLDADNFQEHLNQSLNHVKESQATFQVKVMYRQSHTWQGEITWIETNNTKFFRSALELLELIYFAL